MLSRYETLSSHSSSCDYWQSYPPSSSSESRKATIVIRLLQSLHELIHESYSVHFDNKKEVEFME